MKTQTIQGKEGLWAKVLYDKFEGFVFMPFTQNYPPLNLNPNVDRIYTCITYSNQPIEFDSIDFFVFRKNLILQLFWINEEVLDEGLDI
jgi:hypothetical protein